MRQDRRLWIDTKGQPVVTTTANGKKNAKRWGWIEAKAVPIDQSPTVRIYPFHERYPGMAPLFHVSCDMCPEFGACATEEEANLVALEHRTKEH